MTVHDHRGSEAPAALASAFAIAAGTSAYATPVRFDNDGSFDWSEGVYLDITAGVREQTGLDAGRASFQYVLQPDSYYSYAIKLVVGSTRDAQVEGYPEASVRPRNATVPDDFASSIYGRHWLTSQAVATYSQGGLFLNTQFTKVYEPGGGVGPPEYIAARFDLADGTHYGWMSLQLTRLVGPGFPDWDFDLLAWGYETEPDTPLPAGAAPAPGGALAALALGAAAGMTRGRRAMEQHAQRK